MERLLLAAALLTLFLAPAPNVPHSVFGDWKTSSGSVVRIDHCGADVCLQVVQVAPDATSKTDVKNPNASLRQRLICGLIIGNGFHQDDDVHLSGGHLYDPKSGNDYKGTITVDGDTLRLRGYIGIPLFGRSDTWKRIPAVPVCH